MLKGHATRKLVWALALVTGTAFLAMHLFWLVA